MQAQETTAMQSSQSGKRALFENILLATDFSPSSESALLHSLGIARRYQARVIVAHVVNTSGAKLLGHEAVERAVNDAWRDAHAEMTNQLIAGRLEGIQHEVVVTQGEVWEELSKLIDKYKADLLVTGTRGRTGVWKLLLGSTAEKIFRNSTIPVLTIGPRIATGVPPESGPKRILYSTGFAAHSVQAGKYAFSIARQQQAKLAMIHVAKDFPEDSQPMRAQLERDSRHRLESLIPPDAGLESAPEIFVDFGNPAEAILKVSDHWTPDLVVLGLRPLEDESGKRATWATAYNVVCNAKCPVLTVRTHEQG